MYLWKCNSMQSDASGKEVNGPAFMGIQKNSWYFEWEVCVGRQLWRGRDCQIISWVCKQAGDKFPQSSTQCWEEGGNSVTAKSKLPSGPLFEQTNQKFFSSLMGTKNLEWSCVPFYKVCLKRKCKYFLAICNGRHWFSLFYLYWFGSLLSS